MTTPEPMVEQPPLRRPGGNLGFKLEKVGRRNETAGRKDFDTLHCQEVMRLVQKFALDFVLFEYDQWEYASRCWK